MFSQLCFLLLTFDLFIFLWKCAVKDFPGLVIAEEPEWRNCIEGSTAVVNLAGMPISTRWSPEVLGDHLMALYSLSLLFFFVSFSKIFKEDKLYTPLWIDAFLLNIFIRIFKILTFLYCIFPFGRMISSSFCNVRYIY